MLIQFFFFNVFHLEPFDFFAFLLLLDFLILLDLNFMASCLHLTESQLRCFGLPSARQGCQLWSLELLVSYKPRREKQSFSQRLTFSLSQFFFSLTKTRNRGLEKMIYQWYIKRYIWYIYIYIMLYMHVYIYDILSQMLIPQGKIRVHFIMLGM